MYTLINEHGVEKKVKKGFSWTMFFFGFFVPIIRGDWKWFLISVALVAITGGLAWFVLPFIYNKQYLNDLQNSGYKIVKREGEQI